jgi:septal ring factor EnvC (AmiA/AmiB activator)
MSDTITLDFLGRQLAKLLDEVAEFRDQLTVLTAISMRVEASVTSLTIEVRAMHSQHSRLERRVEALGGRVEALEKAHEP